MEQLKQGNQAVGQDVMPTGPNPADYLSYLHEKRSQEKVYGDFIFADEKMLRIKEIVEQIAEANVPVLISGESGTGKEVIARLIHQSSGRRDAPFVAVNCAAIPQTLLESELFGFEKGSFTGAHQRHAGKFEQASGGTLLLDEITETDQGLQAKLLRALQEKEIERIGGVGPISVNTRIIATTNRDIASLVREGSFRQDLYYRLYVINLEIPPLRHRPKDIEVLTRHFLRTSAAQYHRPNITITQEAMNKLVRHTWPGNVRELQNVLQRVVLMTQTEVITAQDVSIDNPIKARDQDWIKYLPIGRKMREVETQFILETLKNHQGNRTHSAKTLGISLRTLRNKINEFIVEGHDIPQPMTGKPL